MKLNIYVVTYNNKYGQGYYESNGQWNDGTSLEGITLDPEKWLEEHNAEREEEEAESMEEFDFDLHTIEVPDDKPMLPLELFLDMAHTLDKLADKFNCNDGQLNDVGLDWAYYHKLNKRVQYVVNNLDKYKV